MHVIPLKCILNMLPETCGRYWLPENFLHKKPKLCRVLSEHVWNISDPN